MKPKPLFGIAPGAVTRLRALFDGIPGIERVWVFGSRARGQERPDSDIDLAIDAPTWSSPESAAFGARIEQLRLLYRLDCVLLSDTLDAKFRSRIERDRQIFWQPVRRPVDVQGVGSVVLKDFQSRVLLALAAYVAELNKHRAQTEAQASALRVMEGAEDTLRGLADYPRRAWEALRKAGALPAAMKGQSTEHCSRFDGAGRAAPA